MFVLKSTYKKLENDLYKTISEDDNEIIKLTKENKLLFEKNKILCETVMNLSKENINNGLELEQERSNCFRIVEGLAKEYSEMEILNNTLQERVKMLELLVTEMSK